MNKVLCAFNIYIYIHIYNYIMHFVNSYIKYIYIYMSEVDTVSLLSVFHLAIQDLRERSLAYMQRQ